MKDDIAPINLISDSRTIETVKFTSETSLNIMFSDGTLMKVMAETPIACIQGAEESVEAASGFAFSKADILTGDGTIIKSDSIP